MKRNLYMHRFFWLPAVLWFAGGIPSAPAAEQERLEAPVVVVVSPANPTTVLSRQEIEDIFLGRSAQFPDGRQAVPVDQSPDSPAREAFSSRMLERTPAQIRGHWAKIIFTGRGRPPVDVADDDAVKSAIAANPRAIGYIHPDRVDERVSVVELK